MTDKEALELAENVMLKLANAQPRQSVQVLAWQLQEAWAQGFSEGNDVGRSEGWDMLMEQG